MPTKPRLRPRKPRIHNKDVKPYTPRIHEAWYRDIEPGNVEERTKQTQSIVSVMWAFDTLRKVIEERYDNIAKVNRKDYDNAAWIHEQAHRNGQLEELEAIWVLLPSLTDPSETN